jgi:rare lipoprotein A
VRSCNFVRASILILTPVLAGLSTVQSVSAQTVEASAAPVMKPPELKSPSRGFEWFFANIKKPASPCDGHHVVATWYNVGTQTASGQPFNPSGHTAAHRTLPFGSRVTVTNPHNGKSLTVIINDRGPYRKGVTIDLARGAADAIGMKRTQWVCMSVETE